jgi:hypothetical protein
MNNLETPVSLSIVGLIGRVRSYRCAHPGFFMRAITLATLVTVASTALAQEEPAEPAEPTEPADVNDDAGSVGADEFGGADGIEPGPQKKNSAPVTPAPETYVVRPGDTLWTLSQRFLNNPWYWPRVWSYNQDLDNPNWIFPGRQVRFYPSNDAPMPQPQETEEELDFEEVAGGGFEGEGMAGRYSDLGNGRRRREFFVPNEKLNEAGQVLNSPEEKQLLSMTDRSYIKLKKQSAPGDVLQIFRPTREIRHPVTGASLGRLVEMLGEVQVDLLSREQALGTIIASWDAIERGDYVAELPADTEPVRTTENTKNIKGYVVDTGKAMLNFLGENYTLVVDKGEKDGVQVGNTFTVVRAGDPYTKQFAGMADEDIAEILIVEVSKNVSTGILANANREVVPGDRIEMRVPK